MRIFLACLVLAGCTDAAGVATTVVHITPTCVGSQCAAARVYAYDCGPEGDAEVTASTRSVGVLTESKAKDIAGYVQLQYPRMEGETGPTYIDQVLTANQKADV